MPQVRRWQYDDNSGDRSILHFHVHVFIETVPFSFHARKEDEYFPPHMFPENLTRSGHDLNERDEDYNSSPCTSSKASSGHGGDDDSLC